SSPARAHRPGPARPWPAPGRPRAPRSGPADGSWLSPSKCDGADRRPAPPSSSERLGQIDVPRPAVGPLDRAEVAVLGQGRALIGQVADAYPQPGPRNSAGVLELVLAVEVGHQLVLDDPRRPRIAEEAGLADVADVLGRKAGAPRALAPDEAGRDLPFRPAVPGDQLAGVRQRRQGIDGPGLAGRVQGVDDIARLAGIFRQLRGVEAEDEGAPFGAALGPGEAEVEARHRLRQEVD